MANFRSLVCRWLRCCEPEQQSETVSIADVLLRSGITDKICDSFDVVALRGKNAWNDDHPYEAILNTEANLLSNYYVETRRRDGSTSWRWIQFRAHDGGIYVFAYKDEEDPGRGSGFNWHGDGFLKLTGV